MSNNPQTRYRHRTAEIEAVQWTGDNEPELSTFCSPFDFQTIDPEDRVEDPDQTAAVRESVHGTWQGLAPGDWVVKRGKDFYALSAADFAERYEPAVPVPPATPATAPDQAAVRDRIAEALWPLTDWDGDQLNAEAAADAVLAVLPPPADRAAVLQSAADDVAAMRIGAEDPNPDAHVRGYNNGLEHAEAELRRMADEAQQQEADDTIHACPGRWAGPDCRCFDAEAAAEAQQQPDTETACPTPLTHNWGCGCPSDVAAAIASCPGREVDGPSPCRCPCAGCEHHCGAHQPAAGAGQDGAQTEADRG